MKISDLSNLLTETGGDIKSPLVDCLLLTAADLVYVYDLTEGRYLFVNGDTTACLGYTNAEILAMGGDVNDRLVHPQDAQRLVEHRQRCEAARTGELLEVEYRLKHAFGDWHWLSVRDTPLAGGPEGGVRYILGTAQDMSERQAARDKVMYVSTHDGLTGLYNRAYFEAELVRMEKSRYFPISVLFANIDGIRVVNDDQGHEAGDALVRRSAQILKDSFRTEDVIARVGGDEFAVILLATGSASTDAILGRIRTRIQKNNQANPIPLLSLSLGMATAEYGQSLREAVGTAERRMLEVKNTRRSQK